MTDHNYCDIIETLTEPTEESTSRNDVINISDDPDYEEDLKSGPQTRLKTKKQLKQTHSSWTSVRTAPGLRPNCFIFYDGEGYAYHNHKIANNKKYLKCTQKSIKNKPCPARAVIRNVDNMIRHSGDPHTHKPRNYEEDVLKRQFLMIIRERAINETTSNRKIFDEEIKKIPQLKGKISFSSTARRMQRFRQPQKMQGPLFPIEDDELIDAINDLKNISDETINNKDNIKDKTQDNTQDNTKDNKKDNAKDSAKDNAKDNTKDKTFDATNHMEVIEFEDDTYMHNNDYIGENKNLNGKEDSEKVFKKEREKSVNMYCCIYCNKWQEAQLYEFLPNPTSKTMELLVEKPNLDLIPPIDRSSVVIPNTPEKIALSYNQNTTQKDSKTDDKSLLNKNISYNTDISQNTVLSHNTIVSHNTDISHNTDVSQNGDTNDSCNLDNLKMEEDTTSKKETEHPETSGLSKPINKQNKKKVRSKLGFAQMRIDSTVYFDNMGYSYQIQNEKNDKKYLRCIVWGKKKCPGRAHLNKKTLNITRSRGHNHLPSSTCDSEKEARLFLQSIKERAQTETTPLRTIYEDEIKKFPLASSVVNYVNATRRMQRTRRLKSQPAAVELPKETPILLSVQVIPGTRRGTSLYLDELGYHYHNDTLTTNGKIVRCTKNRKTTTEEPCHSRGFLRSSEDGFVIFRTKDHNHPPGNLKRNPMERSFISTLCERARTDLNLTLKDIYNQEIEKFHDVADKIPYRMAWRSMARIRQPPKSCDEVKLVCVTLVSGMWQEYTLYRDDMGFLYSMRKGRRFVWCHMNTKLKCLVKGSISRVNNVLMLEYSGEHNHPSLDDDELQAAIFIEKIMLKCLKDDSKPKKIYDEEIVNFPGVEKRVSLTYAREKIKARRKSLKKNSSHEIEEKCSQPLQFVEFWGDEENPIIEDDSADEANYSEKEEFVDSNIYSDEQGFNYTVVDVQNKTRYLKCIKKDSGCEAQGEIFRGEHKEWLFFIHNNIHNHLPHED